MESLGIVVNSAGDFIRGVHYFFLGVRLIIKPTLRRYLVVPIIVNALILITTFSLFGYTLYHYLQSFTASMPSGLMFLFGWLFWLLYGLISLLLGTLIFTLLSNLIACPFYGLLAEATAKLLVQEKAPLLLVNGSQAPSLKAICLVIPNAVGRELRKLLYFLPWLILCLVCLVFPLTWPLFPFLWWAVLAWVLGIEYTDYQADNQSIPFKQVLTLLKENAMMVFGFGSTISLAMIIPGANLFVPAVAVVGGTALWLSIQSKIELNYKI